VGEASIQIVHYFDHGYLEEAGLAKKQGILIFPRTAGNTGNYWEIRLILNLQI
jgi:hypothetical protein